MVAPGIAIAVIASGTGKTTISTGLIRAPSRRHAVAPFKVGPDYIDPGYHEVAAGHPGHNLDSFMCSLEITRPLYAHEAVGSDIVMVEGVMGLFDSCIGDDPLSVVGSTAEIVLLLGLSVVLVIDIRHMLQSVAAVAHGFSTLRTDVRASGVTISQVGSLRYVDIITRSVEATGAEVLGATPRVIDIEVPSRHLGSVTTVEQGEQLEMVIESMVNLVEIYIDIDWIIQLARQPYPAEPWDLVRFVAPSAIRRRVRVVAVAGSAFSFTYAEHHELLRAAGAEIADFDPLVDELLEAEGCTVSGRFPEEHADALSVCDDIRRDLRQAADDGASIHGECAELLWLFEDLGGRRMCGIIPGRVYMARLKLGYQEAVVPIDSALCLVGTRVRSHEFRKIVLTDDTASVAAAAGWQPIWGQCGYQGETVRDGFVSEFGWTHAGYLHVHPAGVSGNVSRFVVSCAR